MEGPGRPGRSVSAPAQVDPSLLFAYPVSSRQLECAAVFARGQEGGAGVKEEQNDSLSTTDTPTLRKHSSLSDIDCEFEPKCSNTSSLVKAVVDCCISDEESIIECWSNQETYELAKDQTGCRLLQKRLEEDSIFGVQVIFQEILPHATELMVHPFGNYLCQKLIEMLPDQHLSALVGCTHPYLASIALNPHGTRVVQKLIEALCRSPLILTVLAALKPQVLILIKDANGNHVIQRCLTLLQPSFNQFIYQCVCSHIAEVAAHRHGCCVLQRCLDFAELDQKRLLVNAVVEAATELVQDAYGNYAMQYILDMDFADTNERLAAIFTAKIVQLSKQKFSSNVIEKCLQQNPSGAQESMIREISKSENLREMLFDQYANYVVQRALTLATGSLLTDLMKEVRNNMDELRRSQFGKRIYVKLAKKYPDDSDRVPQELQVGALLLNSHFSVMI